MSKQTKLKASASNKAVAGIDADMASLRLELNSVKLGAAVERILSHVLRNADTRKLPAMDSFLKGYNSSAKWVTSSKAVSALLQSDTMDWREATRVLRKPVTEMATVQAFVTALLREPEKAETLLNSKEAVEAIMPMPKSDEALEEASTLDALITLIPKPDLVALADCDDTEVIAAFAAYRATVADIRSRHSYGETLATLKAHVSTLAVAAPQPQAH